MMFSLKYFDGVVFKNGVAFKNTLMVLYSKTVLLLKYFDGVVFKDDGIKLVSRFDTTCI